MKRYIWLVAFVLGACNLVPQGVPEGDGPNVQPTATAWVAEDLGTLGGDRSYAYGVSADGSVVVGTSNTTTASGDRAFRWTASRGMQGLDTPGVYSQAYGTNADGSVVVGSSYASGNLGAGRAVRWTAGGIQDLGTLAEAYSRSYANGTSADGSVVVGSSAAASGYDHPFRWTASGGMQDLGTLGGHSSALGTSADGSVVVGYSSTPSQQQRAFRWTSAGGMQDLGTLGEAYCIAQGVSADGSVVVGRCGTSGQNRAFRWTASGGMQDLGTLGGTGSSAYGTNADGSVVVGSSAAASGQNRAFRWTALGGMQDLGTLGGTFSTARGTNADGSVVVGYSNTASGQQRAVRWTRQTTKDPQTLTFGELAGKSYGDAPFTVTATASSGLPVAFASDTPGVCTVSTTPEGGTVTLVAAGTCTVTASQAGNDDYEAAAPVSRSFAVAKANQTVSFTSTAPDGATVGGSYPVEVSASTGLPVALSAGPEAVCTLDESTVTFVGAGECTVRANQAGNANTNAAPEVTQTVSVVRATTPTTLTNVSGSGTYGDNATLRATLKASSGALAGQTVSFTLNDTPVGYAVTNDDGNATLTGVDLTDVDAGTQAGAVTASFAGDDGLGGSSESGDLTVAKADQTPAFAEGTPTTAERGSSATLEVSSATTTPITLSSSENVCTVSGLEVSFVAVGNCTLTATQDETTNYNAGTATHMVEVVRTLTDTTLTNVSGSGTYGDNATLRATLKANGDALAGKTVSFTLNGTPVGDDTTDGNGDATLAVDLTGVDAGTYTDAVTASFAGDDEDGLAASEALGTLNVTKADQTLSFNSEPPTGARVGDNYTVDADATSGLPVFYRSATPAVCTVPASTVNFVGAGECMVAANQPGNGNYNAAPEITQRTIVAAATDGTALSSVSGAGSYGGAGTLTATLTTGGAPLSGKSVAFTLSGDAVGSATTNGSGVATLSEVGLGGVDAGSYADVVGASFAGDSAFDPTLGSGTLNVDKAAQSVSFTSTPPSNAEVGDSYTVSATATSGLSVSFSSDSSACTVSSETVTFTSVGSCAVRAIQTGNTNYEAAFGTQNVTVQEPAPPTATSDLYTVTFDGLTPGRIISNVALNRGIVSTTGDRTDKVDVYARRRNRGGNVAMVTGSDRELLISKDGRRQTSYARGGYIGFLFRNFGAVDVNTLEVSGVTQGGGNVSVFRDGRRIRSFAVPETGALGSATISIDTEDIGLVVVTLRGPGRVDDLTFEVEQ